MTKKQIKIEDEKIELIVSNIDALSSYQKFSIAKAFNGKSELLLQTLIDDDSTFGVPNADGKLQAVSILAVLLENKNIVGTLQDKLIQACADSQDEEVKVRLAKYPKTPIDIQEKLAQDPNGDIRVELIWRENPEVSILQTLAQDENWAIRREVGKSKHSTPEILELFINENDDDVVLEVLQNPNTTTDIINKFSDKFVKQDGWFGEDGNKFGATWNYKFLTTAVNRLLDSSNNKKDLKNNPLLNYIADHDEEMCRVVLAKRNDVPGSVYNKLYRETDEIIQTYLALSKLSSEELLLKMTKSETTQPMILMNLSDSVFESVRLCTTEHKNIPDIILKKLSFDNSKEVRKAAKDALFIREQEAKSQAVSDDLADR
jgi:hypothetical protein